MGAIKVVRASAGSGKTYQLSYEYVKQVIANPDLYRSILAVTFTNKATEEMKRRIIMEINDLSNGQKASGSPPAFAASLEKELGYGADFIRERARKVRTRILHDYSHFTILTIDKFFQRIIRAFIRELGVESDFTLELQTDSVLNLAADRLIEDTLADEALRGWIIRFVEEQIADGKAWDVKREITELGKEIFKDQYRNLGDSSHSKEEIQKVISEAVATTEKVKTQMVRLAGKALRILEECGLSREDFPYGKNGFINYFYTVASGDVWGGYGKRVSDALDAEERWYSKNSPRKEDIQRIWLPLRALLGEITALFDANIAFVNTTFLLRENFRTYAMLSELAESVHRICRDRNVMLISETNHIIHQLIDGNDAPFIFEKVGNNFSHYMIDEFQDTSAMQWDNFYPLLANALSQEEGAPVWVVGDVKQSIYRWRGGDWEILGSRINASFREMQELTLDKNFRSKGNIVRFNNQMIRAVVTTDNRELNTLLETAHDRKWIGDTLRDKLHNILEQAYTDSQQQVARTNDVGEGYVKMIQYAKEEEGEERHLARQVIELIEDAQRRGFRAADIAVLVRYNAEAVEVAKWLLEYKSAHSDSPYCYDVVTQEALIISNAPVVRFVIACFRLAANPTDSISRAIYLQYQERSVGSLLTEEESERIASLRLVSTEEAFEKLLLYYRLDRHSGDVAYLQAFHEQLQSFGNSKISDIPLFLKWWDDTGSKESVNLPNGQNAITIITIHKAKGLQYPVVILPYANWEMTPKSRTLLWSDTAEAPFDVLGRMPVKFKKSMADSWFAPHYYNEWVYTHVDNINTLYVALTRAEEELYLLMPRSKKREGNRVSDLLLRSIQADADPVAVGEFSGRVTERDDALIYEFGAPVQKQAETTSEERYTIPMNRYPVFHFEGKVRLKRDSDRYRSETGELVLTPRHYGRMMHKVFESVETMDQIAPTLERFVADGTLSPHDRHKIGEMIENALSDPQIRSWFDSGWEVIRNENDIIVPAHTASLRRPDRVMIRRGKVVVLDYKFGQKENNSYVRQIAGYMNLIRQMGYHEVEGYLWYVEVGKVVSV